MILKEAFRIQRRIGDLLSNYNSINPIVDKSNYTTTQIIHHKSELNNLIDQSVKFTDETKNPTVNANNKIEAEIVLKTVTQLLALKQSLSQKIEAAKATISINGMPYDTAIMMANAYRHIVNYVIGDKFDNDTAVTIETTGTLPVISKDNGAINLPYTIETIVTPDADTFKKYKHYKLKYYNKAMELSSLIEAAAFNTKIELTVEEDDLVDVVSQYDTFKDVAKAIN